jgi:hypothetical protein
MRASLEELLSIRDGEPVDAAVRAAVEESAEDRAELERLKRYRAALRELPELEPPPAAWERVRAAAGEPGRTRFERRHWYGGAALAASIALVAVLALSLRLGGDALPGADAPLAAGETMPAGGASIDPLAPSGQAGEVAEAGEAGEARDVGMASLLARSRRLEAALDALPQRPRLTSASTAGTIAELEDRIALIDYRLAEGVALSEAEQEALWRERVELMETLVKVRYAQARLYAF